MKIIITLILACVIKTLTAQNNIVITDVSVITMTNDKVLLHQNVYIVNGLIDNITPYKQNNQFPKNSQIINGAGRFVMPGLVDMHVHLPDGTEPLTLQQAYQYYLQSGVTALRSMRGEKFHPAHRDSIDKGLIKAPLLYISYPLESQDSLLSPVNVANFIQYLKSNRYSFAKYLNGITESKMKEVMQQLKDSNVVVAGHAYKNLKTSIDLGFKSIEHIAPLLEAYRKDTLGFLSLLEDMRKNNVSFCATASFSQIYGFVNSIEKNKSRSGMNMIDTALANTWMRDYVMYENKWKASGKTYYPDKVEQSKKDMNLFYKLLPQLIKADVNVVLSPDNCSFNVPGYAMVEEMKLYKQAGLSNYDILKTSTVNAAHFFNERKWWGTLANGQIANAIVLDKNPLEDVENIKTVQTTIVKGKVLYQKPVIRCGTK